MSKTVLAIDAGTTNVSTMIVGPEGEVLGRAGARYALDYPAPGLVEQDAEQLFQAAQDAIREALTDAKLKPGDIGAIGITGQRSTTILWERSTGRPVCPAIGWQDQRGAGKVPELLSKGFLVNAITAAVKLEFALDRAEQGWERMRRGELAFGNVDSFLAWRLSGGKVHATDLSNACTTGYYNFFGGGWNEKLWEHQKLDPSLFPQLVDTSAVVGETSSEVFGARVPIGALVGDQQAALYAQGGLTPGQGKVSFGTSATCNVNIGLQIMGAPGAYPLVEWRRAGETVYCLEGMVITAGAVFGWLAHGLGLIPDAAGSAAEAETVQDTHGVFFLPALQGLGSPHGQPDRHGLIGGLTLGVRRPHLVRAAMEGVAFRVREMLEAFYGSSGLVRPEVLRVDGGAAMNDVLMQIQSDALGYPVERMEPVEATAFGAALLAGEAVGLWKPFSTGTMRRVSRLFDPAWSESRRDERFSWWKQACGL
jgi:glycerol kinase